MSASPHILPHWKTDEQLAGTQESGLEVYWAWDQFSKAKTPLDAAYAITQMQNAMGDFASWLPGWDYEQGRVRGEGDDQ